MKTQAPLNYRSLCARLTAAYDDPDEGRDVALLLLDVGFGLSLTDAVTGAIEALPPDRRQRLEEMVCRLEQGEPVQYVLNEATFCGRTFGVNKSVLIPRPETEELCRLIVDEWNHPVCCLQPPTPLRLLDIGTGSGCIAITLALSLPWAVVTAWDISSDALLTARDNGRRLQASVDWQLHDALTPPADRGKWDVIVSNPPYIIERERARMRRNVLDHEPGLALFVPDDDPLRFYRAITHYAATALRPEGRLYFEINPLFVDELTRMMREEGFRNVEVLTDFRGHQRMVKGGRA